LKNGYGRENHFEPTIPSQVDCYFGHQLTDYGYVYEWKIPLGNIWNKDYDTLLYEVCDKIIGFDVTITDQDEGTTTARQRMVWQSDGMDNGSGYGNESWNNMDRCGTITMIDCYDVKLVAGTRIPVIGIHPNPARNNIHVDIDFEEVSIYNTYGQKVHTGFGKEEKTVDISQLGKGFYILKAFKDRKLIGVGKFLRE